MKVKLNYTETRSTTLLGDWYSQDLVLARKQFILAVNSKSRLGVLINAAPYATFPERLPPAIAELLLSIGIRKEKVESEINEMCEISLSKTENRSVVGTMVDYCRHLDFMVGTGRRTISNLHELSLEICGTPSLVMEGVWPQEVAQHLFGEPIENTLIRDLCDKTNYNFSLLPF